MIRSQPFMTSSDAVEVQHVQVYNKELTTAMKALKFPGYTRTQRGKKSLPMLTIGESPPAVETALKSKNPKVRKAAFDFMYQSTRLGIPSNDSVRALVKAQSEREKDPSVQEMGKRAAGLLNPTGP